MSEFESEVTVLLTRFASEDSGWAVLEAEAPSGRVVLVGALAHLEEGERALITGRWVQDTRFGRQVKVSQALALPPTDPAAVLAYLRRLPHVGARRAQRLVDRFGVAEVIAEVDRDPAGALALAGLGAPALAAARDAWEGLRATRRLHLLLAPHGLSYLVRRVHESYGARAYQAICERPYSLTRLFGVGFALADRIARSLGTPIDARERALAGVAHLLTDAERAGSTCLPQDDLVASLQILLGTAPAPGLLEDLVEEGEIVLDGPWVYRRETAELEAELAEQVAALLSDGSGGRLRAPGEPQTGGRREGPDEPPEAGGPPELTDEQRAAVRAAFSLRLSLITGGPGTGKTATVRALAAEAVRQHARVLLLAPTGRAALRISESAGLQASTVHSALGWIPGEGPAHDGQDPVRCDLLVLDESSMANLELLVALLRAVPEHAHVVLVGDADQLAPVGAGKPFAELVAGGAVPAIRLSHIFRQAAGSMIVQGAHAIRRGRMPELAPAPGMRRDLFMIERADPLEARAEIVSLVTERLPAHYGVDPIRDIQVFAPVYRGDLGIDALNDDLRAALNPDGRAVRGGRLRLGDKLMMTGRNLHEVGLMNGTILTLLDEVGGEHDDRALILASEEGVFRLPPEQWEQLRPAYACSVHRGQGIELPVAVIVAHRAGGAFFLRREMLYTALTRARLATVIVGSRQVLGRAARTPDTARRHSRLGERLERAGPTMATLRRDNP